MNSFSQTVITYGYDDCGNRTTRSISITPIQEKSLADTTNTENLKDVSNSSLSINIYPNPTKGILKVETSFAPDGSKIEAILFNLQGDMIQKKRLSVVDEIDISDQPDGIFILKIFISGSANSWKIIKNTK